MLKKGVYSVGYYKYYIRKLLKVILRWFDKKTLILIIIFLLFLCWNNGVFAAEGQDAILLQYKIATFYASSYDSNSDSSFYNFSISKIYDSQVAVGGQLYTLKSGVSYTCYNASSSNLPSYIFYDMPSDSYVDTVVSTNFNDLQVTGRLDTSLWFQTSGYHTFTMPVDCWLFVPTEHTSAGTIRIYQENGVSNIYKILDRYFSTGTTSTEKVSFSPSYINSIGASPSSGKFNSVPDSASQNNYWSTFYFPLEKGETYSISLGTNFYNLRYGFCQQVPAVGVPFSTVNVKDGTQTFDYSFVADGNYSYFYLSVNMRTYISIREFFKTVTTTEDNPLNVFDNMQKNHEETISNQNQNTEKVINTLTDNSVSEDSYNIDTSFTGDINEDSYDNVLSSMINNIIHTLNSSSISIISIPIPNTDKSITLESNIISKHIQGTLIYTLIQTFWYFAFGVYFFRFGYSAINWLTSGKMIEKGPSAFADYLSSENATITSDMM